jgi:hypothetical protein
MKSSTRGAYLGPSAAGAGAERRNGAAVSKAPNSASPGDTPGTPCLPLCRFARLRHDHGRPPGPTAREGGNVTKEAG